MITVYAPDVQVWLHKTIDRKTTNGKDAVSTRYTGSANRQVIDLRPFLGDGGGVQTSKSVRDPSGGFSLTLVDKPDGNDGTFESLYGLIEPMDVIEIRARHGAPASAGKAPIVMWGFVSDVGRSESAGGDGRPQRAVTVSGQDYGKIWQILQISYLQGYIVGAAYISGFALMEMYGLPAVMGASELMTKSLDNIINPFLKGLLPEKGQMPLTIKPDVDNVAPAMVSPGIQTHQGTIYEMLRYYGDVGPWNELFTEDREDGVHLVYRANPYVMTDGSGKQVQAEAPAPVYVDVDQSDLMALQLSRSDRDLANYFWVQNQRFNLIGDTFQRQTAVATGDPSVDLGTYANSAVRYYGPRVMSLESQQGGADTPTMTAGGKSADVDKVGASSADWMSRRRKIVADSNKDNVVLERGVMRMRGREDVRAGRYIRLRRGSMTADYYVVQVDHEFVPFQGFFTTAYVERGTGFMARVASSGSPYFMEQTR